MALTRRDIVILALLACLASGVALLHQPASPSLAAHDTAIREVILQQIEAFGRGDDDAALRLPHPTFRHNLSGRKFLLPWSKRIIGPSIQRINWHFPKPPAPCRTRPKRAFNMSLSPTVAAATRMRATSCKNSRTDHGRSPAVI